MSLSLWDWARQAYAAPDVQAACLDLQDTAGQNTCVLLWAAWAAASGRALDADDLETAAETARAWDDAAVTPLRALRRSLKARRLDMNDAAREAVRDQVKAVELDAERRLLAQLEAQTPPATGATTTTLDALVAASRAWGGITPRAALARLAEHLPTGG